MEENKEEELAEGTLLSHLVELRSRLLVIAIAVVIVFIALLPFSGDIFTLVSEPLRSVLPGNAMIATAVASPLLTPFKLTFFTALFIVMPIVLFQIWTKNNLYILLEGSGYSMSPSLSYTFRMYKCQGIATGKMRKKVRKYFKRGFKRTHQDCTYITALETLNVQADTNDKIASGVILTQIAESEPQPYKEKIISIL